jgi:large repetitive protein
VVSDSEAVGDFAVSDPNFPGHDGAGSGGGVFNQDGTLTIAHSSFIDDDALGANDGTGGLNTDCGDAEGGCINNSAVNANAYLTISDSVFIGNQAIAGSGGAGSVSPPGFYGIVDVGSGGAITNYYDSFVAGKPVVTGVAAITNCEFIGNEAHGGSDAVGGNASRVIVGIGAGGAVWTDEDCNTVMNNCSFIGNEAIAGSGGSAGPFGPQSEQVDVGEGAAIGDIGAIFVNRTSFSHNIAKGGAGSDGDGGAIALIFGVGNGTVLKSSFVDNSALGGAGGNGEGGGLYNGLGNTTTLVADTFTENSALGSSPGQGKGGGIFSPGTITQIGTAAKHNRASTSNNVSVQD